MILIEFLAAMGIAIVALGILGLLIWACLGPLIRDTVGPRKDER